MKPPRSEFTTLSVIKQIHLHVEQKALDLHLSCASYITRLAVDNAPGFVIAPLYCCFWSIYYVVFCVFAAHVFIQCCAAQYCQGLVVIVNVIFQDWFSAHNKSTHPLYDRHKLPRCSLWAAEHMIVMIVRRCRARRGWGLTLKEKVTDVSCLQMTWALSGKVSSKWQVKATDCKIMSADWSLNSEPSYQHKNREKWPLIMLILLLIICVWECTFYFQ